ncbi:MAG: cupin domain-containing protein [Deltaproteobacteria bacterium]|nr:cupin domain-containing protein [Deltaproteobacteria bacterium]
MYVSAKAIAAMEAVRRVHNLNPAAIRMDKSLGDAVGLKNIGIHLISIAPGDKSTEFHTHRYEEEAIYVLSGRGTEVIGEATHQIGPGDFVGFPAAGAAHETINDGTEPLVCLVIGQRLAQDVVDYPRKGKRLYRNGGERDMVAYENLEKR